MTFEIAALLLQDSVVNAAIYSLLALSLVLVFSVTRVIYVPQGEFVSFAALTFIELQQGRFPSILYMLAGLGGLAAIYELAGAFRIRSRPDFANLGLFLLYPPILILIARVHDLRHLSAAEQMLATLAIIVPLGPIIYRIVFQPLADAKILVLLIAAVATELVLVGLGLYTFGPEGSRAAPLTHVVLAWGPFALSGQGVCVLLCSIVLMAALAGFFSWTVPGKALRATAINRIGARLVGIRPQAAGRRCFCLAAFIGAASGVLIAPITTVYYDFGFPLALKGFVAAIIGGLVSYPIAVAGALFVGVVESFASFWASAYREVIVFILVVPILLMRSITAQRMEEDQ